MPRFTTNNGVLDWSPLIYGALLALVVIAILIGGVIWLRVRRAKIRQTDTATEAALKQLEPMIWELFQRTEHNTNVDRYSVWRTHYINVAERRYGKDVWRVSIEKSELPPVNEATQPIR